MKKLFLVSSLFALLIITSSVFTSLARAEVVEFSEEQLASESVTPVFDQPAAVKKRYVPMEQRFEFGTYVGSTLSDAFFTSYPFGLSVDYHFSEIHSITLSGAFFISTQSSYVAQIQNQTASAGLIPFNSAPNPKYMGLAEYEFTPYYGKISLAKQAVLNLSISGTLGGGYMGLGSEGSPVAAIGLNERFFLTRNFGIKVDLRALLYQETDVVLVSTATNPSKTNVSNILFSVGVLYFLPTL